MIDLKNFVFGYLLRPETFTCTLRQSFNLKGYEKAWVFVKIDQLNATKLVTH